MQKNKLTLSLAVIIVIGAGLYALMLPAKNNPSSRTNPKVAEVKKASIVSYSGKDGVDAFTLLKENATVESQDFGADLGVFVTAINGVDSNNDSYWIMYVNGVQANESASKYITKNSDKIEWRFEKFTQ
ncbi:MAG: hypothetical protein CEN91_545 [Candidatus Berkelbacteria bacterium Licking1014_85]|uniref:Transcobalamin-like C-terminal domain-containing protein n=1 Tax=Candidatus Berkelbacteria bacterium Licking1014_85 TaxID=2017148 RepID=A0A554LH72_9BACT|nr:MAG: hypothetical protein CEN91_545 [Candidatus Berkelbacteria bacterium Licking1014_85]